MAFRGVDDGSGSASGLRAGFALIVPSIAVQVRRFHDQGRTGWLVLLGFVPYIGGFIVPVFMCLPEPLWSRSHGPAWARYGRRRFFLMVAGAHCFG